jgi:hypothetical protein
MYTMVPLSMYFLDSAAPFTYFLTITGSAAGSPAQTPFDVEFMLRAGMIWGAVIVACAVILMVHRKPSSRDRPRYNYDKELDEIRRGATRRTKAEK